MSNMFISIVPSRNETLNYVGYSDEIGNIALIIISILGFIINLIFSADYLTNIIKIKNRKNNGISAVEKMLCVIAIIETFISIFWMLINYKGQIIEDKPCKYIGQAQIFFNLFDWLILSTSLYQIKIILLNPKQILVSGKRVFNYVILCLLISIASLALSVPADLGGVSPMLTCFISIDNLESTYQKVLLWIFLIIPLFSFAFGGIQVYLIMKSPEYKNNENNRNFFVEYSYFVITYIISSILIILTYIIYYIIIHTDISGIENEFYRAFICIVTFLTCSTPLIVGIIRFCVQVF